MMTLKLVKVDIQLWSLALKVINESTETSMFKYMPIHEFSFTRLYDKITIRASFDLINREDLVILKRYVTVLLPKSEGILKDKLVKSKKYIDNFHNGNVAE